MAARCEGSERVRGTLGSLFAAERVSGLLALRMSWPGASQRAGQLHKLSSASVIGVSAEHGLRPRTGRAGIVAQCDLGMGREASSKKFV